MVHFVKLQKTLLVVVLSLSTNTNPYLGVNIYASIQTILNQNIMIPTRQFHVFLIFCGLNILLPACSPQEQLNHKQSDNQNAASPTSAAGDEERVDVLFYIEGQLCQHLRKIYQDKSGVLWLGTNVYGLLNYDGDSLSYLKDIEGIAEGRITGIREDNKGNVWFSSSGGMTKFDGSTFTNFREDEGPFNNEIWSFVIDKSGTFWLGTHEGVRLFDGDSYTDFPIPKGQVRDTTSIISYDRVNSVLADSKGNMWFGTDGFGICKWNGVGFTNFTTDNGLCDNNIGDLFEDSSGNIWISTSYGGMCMFDGKSFRNFATEGLIDGVEAGAIYEDKRGNIWFAVEHHGVYKYDGESFVNYNEKDGLNTSGVLSIYQDREDRFWFGGWGGLFRFDGETFTSVTKDGPWER